MCKPYPSGIHCCVGIGQKCCIIPRHIQLPMKNDEELGKLLARAMISSGVGIGRKCRIIPRHIQLPMKNNEELGKLLARAMISSGGVMPNIH
ncbi:hypothetical protein ZIOFF_054963 [Zingiber officinale]|uniref:Histone H2A C-terminal domain-containing protein n=1 Tax=Zingiber officinale TaxID=94328 RepID=A0A8J5KJX6_ZINOF|nr:hypothetical protein ZIOFF_054963 [Zingiber officinale]